MDDLGLRDVPPGEGAGVAPGVELGPGLPGREAPGGVVGERGVVVSDGAHQSVTYRHVWHGGSAETTNNEIFQTIQFERSDLQGMINSDHSRKLMKL